MGIPELVEDGASGLLVPPGRADLLADALERLARDPQLRARMGARGRELVCAGYDVRDSVVRLHELFTGRSPALPAAPETELRDPRTTLAATP
jgi:glycosyltransferase involved in cell wall biosynthesis